jgi:hypothetical protein
MESAGGFILIVLILLILGAGGYFAYDYIKYKQDLEDQLETTKKNVQANQNALVDEQKKRLSNLKYVVDQINTTNEDIYNTFTSNVKDTRTATTSLDTRQAQIIASLGSFMRFSTGGGAGGAASSNVDILNLPGTPTANMELLRRVSTIHGMNFNELKQDTTVKFCGQALNGAAARCIQLPRTDGKTVFTNLVDQQAMLMDGNVEFASNVSLMNINGGVIESTSTTKPLSLRSNKFIQIGNQLNLGDSAGALAAATPASYISIQTETATTKDALQVSTPTIQKALRVDANGRLLFNDTRHSIGQGADGALNINTNGLVVQTNPAENNQAITLTGNTVSVTGTNITLTGNVNVVGSLKVGGMPVSVGAA